MPAHMLRLIALVGLLASPVLAQQVTPSFGLDSSGSLRQLYVRDPTLPGFVPMGSLDTTTHLFAPAATLSTLTAAPNYHPNVAPAYIRTQGYSVPGTGGGLYVKLAAAPSHPYRFSITLADASTVWYGIAPSERPVNPEMLGAIGDDGLEDNAALLAAFGTNTLPGIWPLSGLGKTYNFTANPGINLRDGIVLQDMTIQGGATPARVLTNNCGGCTGPFTLKRVKIIRGPVGTIADYAGIWISLNGAVVPHDVYLEDVEVTGGGAGSGIQLLSVVNGRMVRPWVHDIEWTNTDGTDPAIEQVQGIRCSTCTNVEILDARVQRLWGTIPWIAGQDLAPSQGLPWRTNAGNSYRATALGGTSGTTPPTCTSGTCSDGLKTWTYMGPAATAKRSYQADGLAISAATHVIVRGGLVEWSWEGSDVSGAGQNRDVWFYNVLYKDIDGWGQKWVHSVVNSGSIGCRVYRSGLAGLTIGGGNVPDISGGTHLRIVDMMVVNPGASQNWGNAPAFWLTGGGIPGVDIQVINPLAIDDQAVHTMNYGFYTEQATTVPATVVNGRAYGYLTADFYGPINRTEVTDAGWETTGQQTIVNTDNGQEAVALALTNHAGATNTGVAIDMNPTSNAPGGRSAQIVSTATTGGSVSNLVFRTANGSAPADRLTIAGAGGATFSGALTVTGATTHTGATTFNGVTTNNATSTITNAAGGVLQTLIGTNDTATTPIITQRHTRATPTNNDGVGAFRFEGTNSTPANFIYATIAAVADSIVAGAEAGTLRFNTSVAGTNGERFRIGQGVQVNTGSALTDPGLGNLRVAGGVQVAISTVALLPSCNGPLEGMMRGVTDANSTTYNATAAGAGTNHMPVYCNGTNWVLH